MKVRSPPERSENNPFRSTKPTGAVRQSANGKPVNATTAASADNSDDKKKRVNVGVAGETPKKIFHFERDPAKFFDHMENIVESSENDEESGPHTPERESPSVSSNGEDVDEEAEQSAADFLRQLAAENASFDRPKTSRGKSHPSPDEFFNYVIPSPEANRRGGRSRLVLDREEGESQHHIKWADTTKDVSNLSNANSNRIPGVKESTEDDEGSVSGKARHLLSDSYLLGFNLEGVSRDKQIALLGCWLFGSALRI